MSLITPHQLDLYSSNMAHLYNALEGEMLRIMIKQLSTGTVLNVHEWQLEKMQMLGMYNRRVLELLADLTPYAEEQIERVFKQTVEGVIEDVDGSLPYEVPPPRQSHIDAVMRGYHKQVWMEVDNYVNQTLVSTNYGFSGATQAYTDTLNRTSALFNTGIYTFEDALEKSITELADKGIKSSFVDKGGHRWSMERYVGTVMKSTLNNTYDEVRKERMAEFGEHLVVVTSHMGAREACFYIQGEVVDLREPQHIPSGSSYKSIYDSSWGADYGTKGGHRGINCQHAHIPFIEGVNVNNQPKYDKAKNDEVAADQARQRQIERNIVKYKKRAMVSEELGTGKADYYKDMVSKWDNKMKEHLRDNGEYLSRNLPRERVYTPIETLLEERELYSR